MSMSNPDLHCPYVRSKHSFGSGPDSDPHLILLVNSFSTSARQLAADPCSVVQARRAEADHAVQQACQAKAVVADANELRGALHKMQRQRDEARAAARQAADATQQSMEAMTSLRAELSDERNLRTRAEDLQRSANRDAAGAANVADAAQGMAITLRCQLAKAEGQLAKLQSWATSKATAAVTAGTAEVST